MTRLRVALGAAPRTELRENVVDLLLCGSAAAIAGKAEIHQMSMADGVMRMRQLLDGLPVPAKSSVALEPNSYHLMFTGLKRPLKEGDGFAGSLTFEHAGTVVWAC